MVQLMSVHLRGLDNVLCDTVDAYHIESGTTFVSRTVMSTPSGGHDKGQLFCTAYVISPTKPRQHPCCDTLNTIALIHKLEQSTFSGTFDVNHAQYPFFSYGGSLTAYRMVQCTFSVHLMCLQINRGRYRIFSHAADAHSSRGQ